MQNKLRMSLITFSLLVYRVSLSHSSHCLRYAARNLTRSHCTPVTRILSNKIHTVAIQINKYIDSSTRTSTHSRIHTNHMIQLCGIVFVLLFYFAFTRRLLGVAAAIACDKTTIFELFRICFQLNRHTFTAEKEKCAKTMLRFPSSIFSLQLPLILLLLCLLVYFFAVFFALSFSEFDVPILHHHCFAFMCYGPTNTFGSWYNEGNRRKKRK